MEMRNCKGCGKPSGEFTYCGACALDVESVAYKRVFAPKANPSTVLNPRKLVGSLVVRAEVFYTISDVKLRDSRLLTRVTLEPVLDEGEVTVLSLSALQSEVNQGVTEVAK